MSPTPTTVGLRYSAVGADFSNSTIDTVNFTFADMSYSTFDHANLHSSNFKFADLSYSNFNHASFDDTTFASTNINGADFTVKARLPGVGFRTPVRGFSSRFVF